MEIQNGKHFFSTGYRVRGFVRYLVDNDRERSLQAGSQNQYKQITKQETGKIGPLYYPCVVSVNLALVCGIVGLVLK